MPARMACHTTWEDRYYPRVWAVGAVLLGYIGQSLMGFLVYKEYTCQSFTPQQINKGGIAHACGVRIVVLWGSLGVVEHSLQGFLVHSRTGLKISSTIPNGACHMLIMVDNMGSRPMRVDMPCLVAHPTCLWATIARHNGFPFSCSYCIAQYLQMFCIGCDPSFFVPSGACSGSCLLYCTIIGQHVRCGVIQLEELARSVRKGA